MGLIKEPKGIDFVVRSEPWTDQELKDFREEMKHRKKELDPKVKAQVKKLSKWISKQEA